jgi:hypothetical protein
MGSLKAILKQEISWYATGGFNVQTYLLSDEIQVVYAVLVVDTPIRYDPVGVVVMARIEGDKIIIEEDLTDKPLAQRLIAAGIPPEQIIRAYAGESIPPGAGGPQDELHKILELEGNFV